MSRVSRNDDYIDDLARSIERERARDPDAVHDWDWWKEQAARYSVTPNNIYSRAIARGLYTPPSRRTNAGVSPAAGQPRARADDSESNESSQHRAGRSRPGAADGRGESMEGRGGGGGMADSAGAAADRTTTVRGGSRPEKKGTGDAPPGTANAGTPATATSVIAGRLRAMADVAGVLQELEARIAGLEQEKNVEDARRHEAMRALDRLGRVLEEAVGTVAALKQLYIDS